jgi:hypothetical protein
LKNRNKLRYGSDQIKDFNLSHWFWSNG